FFGKALVVVLRSVNVRTEVARQVEQLRFLLHKDLVRAAGQVEREAALLQVLQRRPRTEYKKIVAAQSALAQTLQARPDTSLQPPQVFAFVVKRLLRLSPALSDALRQLDHLVDGLFAVEPHDVVEAKLAASFFGLARLRRQQLGEHRHHYLRPT